jgi:hypothetical protein
MSTKIYNGYKINLTGESLMKFLVSFHEEKIDPIIDEQILYFGKFRLYLKKVFEVFNNSDIPEDCEDLLERIIADLGYSIQLFPKDDYTLAIFYGNKGYEKMFASLDDVEYWGYWNNTDPQEGISDEEWSEREEDWEVLRYGVPVIRDTLSWTPFTEYDLSVHQLRWVEHRNVGWIDPIKCRDHAVSYWMGKNNIDQKYIGKYKWKIPVKI